MLEIFFLEKNYNSKIHINNFKILKNLNNISHVFINKNSLLDKEKSFTLNGLLLTDKYIELNDDEKFKMKNYFFQMKSKSGNI